MDHLDEKPYAIGSDETVEATTDDEISFSREEEKRYAIQLLCSPAVANISQDGSKNRYEALAHNCHHLPTLLPRPIQYWYVATGLQSSP